MTAVPQRTATTPPVLLPCAPVPVRDSPAFLPCSETPHPAEPMLLPPGLQPPTPSDNEPQPQMLPKQDGSPWSLLCSVETETGNHQG